MQFSQVHPDFTRIYPIRRLRPFFTFWCNRIYSHHARIQMKYYICKRKTPHCQTMRFAPEYYHACDVRIICRSDRCLNLFTTVYTDVCLYFSILIHSSYLNCHSYESDLFYALVHDKCTSAMWLVHCFAYIIWRAHLGGYWSRCRARLHRSMRTKPLVGETKIIVI